jgi:hypothetical protein
MTPCFYYIHIMCYDNDLDYKFYEKKNKKRLANITFRFNNLHYDFTITSQESKPYKTSLVVEENGLTKKK